MKLNQKKAFNPIAQGYGTALIIIGLAFLNLLIYSGYYPLVGFIILTLLIYLGLWINFSSVQLYRNSKNELIRTYGMSPLIIKNKIKLSKYDCILIKSEKVSYSAKSTLIGSGTAAISKYSENYIGLYLKYNRKYDFNLMIKSSKREIIEFIKSELMDYNLPIFEGALKKGQELKL